MEPSLSISFGPFELHPERRQLLQRGEPVRLGSRALELLIALTERAGELMSRSELESRLWPSTVVEETSLRVHVSALRKVLGEGGSDARYIANVPGRGYSFVAPLERIALARVASSPQAPCAAPAHNLPGRIARVIGRAEITETLTADVRRSRLVSLVGPGGMGKTTVALVVAKNSLTDFVDGVRFIDLSPLSAGSAILSLLALSLDLDVDTPDVWALLRDYISTRRMLLVLDNCEHVIQSAAEVVERLLLAAPHVHVLATSREALNVEGERVHRLAALLTPQLNSELSVEKAAQSPAIQLFVERASANAAEFDLNENTLPHVRSICHRLDGIPLAIELAAARVDTLGVEGLAGRLDNMFELLTRGRRTAFPRHRTLQALLDWSHDLLPETERAVLRRLSVFRSVFSLSSAASLCCDSQIDVNAVIECLLSLVAQSLIAVDKTGDSVKYRLLYTTRTYAEQKLVASGERSALARRHAEHLRDILLAAHPAFRAWSPWTGDLVHMVEDVHSAIDWSLTPDGDTKIGVALVTTAFAPMYRIGVSRDNRQIINTLLDKIRQLSPPDPQLELRLQTSLAFMSATSDTGQPQAVLFDRTMTLVEEVGTPGDHIEAQYGLCVGALGKGDYAASRGSAQRIGELAIGEHASLSVVLADRLMAQSLHFLGEHSSARLLAQRVLRHRQTTPIERRFDTVVPPAMSMGGMLARMRWIEGCSEEATLLSQRIVEAASTAVPIAICQTFSMSVLPVAFWRGDLSEVRRLLDRLHDCAAQASNAHWGSWARMFERVLQAKQSGVAGEPADGYWPESTKELDMLPTLVPEWLSAGTLARVESGAVGWNAPEVLRASALQLMSHGSQADFLAAEEVLLRAQALAERQGALAWQLRISCTLTTLRRQQGKAPDGRRVVEDVLARFTEGRQDADQVAARSLLDRL